MIRVKSFFAHNDLRNYSYLILDEESGDSWVIDPYEAESVSHYIKKNHLVLKGILNTHQHHDHIRGNGPLQAMYGAPIRKLSSSETLRLDERNTLKTIDAPGHTMDHQVFVWQSENSPQALFAGDTLFNAGVGNCKNGGDIPSLYETVKKLFHSLPKETILYPGHDYLEKNLLFAKTLEPENVTISERLKQVRDEDVEARSPFTLGEECEVNPFVRLESEEIRHHLREVVNETKGEEKIREELFTKMRKLRDHF